MSSKGHIEVYENYNQKRNINKMNYDVVIVGGGPSGSSLGYMLAKKGKKVAIVDKAKFPRHKLCGGLMAHKARFIYEKMLGKSIDEIFVDKTDQVRFFMQDKHFSSFNTQILDLIDRVSFDNYLIEHFVAAGGTLYENSMIRPASITENQVMLTSGEVINFKVLVGADGALSEVRKLIEPEYQTNCFCFEAFVPAEKNTEANDVCIYFNYIRNGYAWKFPAANGAMMYGIGGETSWVKDTKAAFKNFLEDYDVADKVGPWQGAFLPIGNYVKEPFSRSMPIILTGDAAGLANAITGEGLYYAAASGLFAFQAITEYLDDKADLNTAYLEKLELIHHHIRMQEFINKGWKHPWFKRIYFKTLGFPNWSNRYVCNHFITGNYKATTNKLHDALETALL
jgi:geranylgeranyl reductase family protein